MPTKTGVLPSLEDTRRAPSSNTHPKDDAMHCRRYEPIAYEPIAGARMSAGGNVAESVTRRCEARSRYPPYL